MDIKINSEVDKMFKNPIGKYLSITHRAHTSLIDKIFQEKFSLSHGQVFKLLCIYKNEGISQNSLCEFYKLDKSGVVRIVKKPADKGLVVRKSDSEDRRKKLIYLSEKAKNMKEDFMQTLQGIEEKMRKNISESQIEGLIDKTFY